MTKIEKVVYKLKHADHVAKQAREELEKQRKIFRDACTRCERLEGEARDLREEFQELAAESYGVNDD